jgi:mycoredoxin
MSVEAFLSRYDIPVDKINIDRDPEAREELMVLNGGYASVPTLLFADGTMLTEPSFGQLRQKLGLKPPPGFMKRLLDAIGRDG